jgi:hypothetical protein
MRSLLRTVLLCAALGSSWGVKAAPSLLYTIDYGDLETGTGAVTGFQSFNLSVWPDPLSVRFACGAGAVSIGCEQLLPVPGAAGSLDFDATNSINFGAIASALTNTSNEVVLVQNFWYGSSGRFLGGGGVGDEDFVTFGNLDASIDFIRLNVLSQYHATFELWGTPGANFAPRLAAVAPIPEPQTCAMLLAGLMLLWFTRSSSSGKPRPRWWPAQR